MYRPRLFGLQKKKVVEGALLPSVDTIPSPDFQRSKLTGKIMHGVLFLNWKNLM